MYINDEERQVYLILEDETGNQSEHGCVHTERHPMDAQKQPQSPWVYNRDYTIPADQRQYDARVDIPIPADIDPGDYHFMVRLTDRAGWQQLKAVAIKIVE